MLADTMDHPFVCEEQRNFFLRMLDLACPVCSLNFLHESFFFCLILLAPFASECLAQIPFLSFPIFGIFTAGFSWNCRMYCHGKKTKAGRFDLP
jgi:hypothetical protein